MTTTDLAGEHAYRERFARQHKEVADILFDHWDPIGINQDPTAPRDEYKTIALGAMAIADQQAPEMLTKWLGDISELRIGVEANPERSQDAADRIIKVLLPE